ncbi:hypothetical protein GCM10023262_14080 [Bartonella pachyuromydis]|uniref:Uncharacterized protein n=1 Tax=Bartonella pachyuromydis TaxID=931097 RepID=A0ABP8VK55_9HYPH
MTAENTEVTSQPKRIPPKAGTGLGAPAATRAAIGADVVLWEVELVLQEHK